MRDKKKGRAVGGSGRKKTRPPFFCRGAGHIHPLLSPSLLLPTTLPCQNINHNLYSSHTHQFNIHPYVSIDSNV
ncbi:hypothetical protein [Aneurinibacillus migulanus]|uniref:hypothetical protein n=1 Tax=Aneurinibacillus migulanus TaxID=47500 RepID=UPI001F248EBB|nr:hypothetical protein [Aneurinibacillus migulanus]